MSMLDDLLEEVKIAAKQEALKDYENEIDRLRKVVESMERQIASMLLTIEKREKESLVNWDKYATLHDAISAALARS